MNLTAFPAGDQGAYLGFSGGLIVDTGGNGVVVYGPADPQPGACSRSSRRACRGEMAIIFFGPVRDFSFSTTGLVPADDVIATLRFGQTVVGQAVVAQDGSLPPFAAPITHVTLNFDGTSGTSRSGGARLNAFSFTSLPPGTGRRLPRNPAEQVLASFVTALRPFLPETLDFTRATPLNDSPTIVTIDGATIIATDGDELFLYEPSEFDTPGTGAICALKDGFQCLGDLLVVFDTLVRDLSFRTFFFRQGDAAEVNVYGGDTLLASRMITFAGLVDFAGIEGISHIEILDRSSEASNGFAYGDFRYTAFYPVNREVAVPPVSAVPLPGAVWGLMAGLIALGGVAAGRRKEGET